MLYNQKLYICQDLVELIVKKAANILIDTPPASRIRTDSFDSDYEPDHMLKIEADLNLDNLDEINKSTDMTKLSDMSMSKKGKHKKCKGSPGQSKLSRKSKKSNVKDSIKFEN